MSSLHRYLLNSASNTQVNDDGRRFSTDQEVEAFIEERLSADEKVFVSRYPLLCKAFDRASYEWLYHGGYWPKRVDWRPTGIPAGVGYFIARTIAGRVIDLVEDANRHAIISSGTFRFGSFEEAQVAIDTTKRNGVCRLIFVAVHGKDHCHVLHDCPLSHGSCKCFSGFIPKRRSAQKHFISKLSKARLAKIIFYYFNNEKWIYYLKIGDSRFTSALSATAQADRLGLSGGEGLEGIRILEGCDDEDGLLFESEHARESEGDLSSGGDDKGQPLGRSTKRTKKESLSDIIYRKLRVINCSPLKDFSRTTGWFEDSLLRSIKPTKEEVLIAYNRLTFEVMGRSLREFANIYQVQKDDCEEDGRFHFGSLKKNKFYEFYFTKRQSLVWLKKLLIWQYARDHIEDNGRVKDKLWKDDVFAFVEWLAKFLDGECGKKNTWYIVSPPNAGKTFFCDMIAHYLLSAAHLKHWNRTSGFPLEELEGARVAFWNEPNFESGNIPEMLKLLGGDNLSVAIKYQRASTIQNVPIIVTSNYLKFPNTSEFNERITYQRWTQCDILIDIDKKRLHPFALDLLFDECENYLERKIRK